MSLPSIPPPFSIAFAVKHILLENGLTQAALVQYVFDDTALSLSFVLHIARAGSTIWGSALWGET